MPPAASQTIARRLSRASEHSFSIVSAISTEQTSMEPAIAVETTPTLDGAPKNAMDPSTLSLPTAAMRASRTSDEGSEASRLSFSSLRSSGSAAQNGVRGIAPGGTSSLALSEADCLFPCRGHVGLLADSFPQS